MATSTFNSQTGSGGTTMDGEMDNGYATTWSGVRSTVQGDGVGSLWNPTNTYIRIRALHNGSGYYGCRGGMTFDTSALTSGAVISSAVLSVYGTSINFVSNDSTSLEVVSFNPATKGTFIDSDWTTAVYTALATGINFASLNQAGYNDFTLNATGISNINKTGISSFMVMTGLDLNNTSPGSITHDNVFQFNSVDNGTNVPKLVVTYTVPVINGNFLAFM
jgi:hypothetical protein